MTGESRDSKRHMQQPRLSVPVSTLGLPNYLNFPSGLTPTNGSGGGPRSRRGTRRRLLPNSESRAWTGAALGGSSARARRVGPSRGRGAAASGRRGAAGLCKTTPRATAAPGRPARGLRVPVPLVPGLTGAPRSCSPGCHSARRQVSHPPVPRPDRTVPSGRQRASG